MMLTTALSKKPFRLQKAASDDDDEDFVPPPGLEDHLQGTPRHTGFQQQVPAAPGPSRTQPAYELGAHQRQRPSSGARPSAGPAQQAAQSASGAAQRPTPQQPAPQLPGKPSPATAQQAGQLLPLQHATPDSGPRRIQPLSFYDQVIAGASDAANASAAASAAGQQASLQGGRTPGHAPPSEKQARLEQPVLPQGLQQVTMSTSHPDADATAGRQAHPESGKTPGHVPGGEEQARLERGPLAQGLGQALAGSQPAAVMRAAAIALSAWAETARQQGQGDAAEGSLPAPLSPAWVGRRSRSPVSRIGRVPGAPGGSDKSASREQQQAGGEEVVQQALQSSSGTSSRQAAAAMSAPRRAIGAHAANDTAAAPSGSTAQPKVPSRLRRCHSQAAPCHSVQPGGLRRKASDPSLAGSQETTGTPDGLSQQQATSSTPPEAGQPAQQQDPSGLQGPAASPKACLCRQQEEPSSLQEAPLAARASQVASVLNIVPARPAASPQAVQARQHAGEAKGVPSRVREVVPTARGRQESSARSSPAPTRPAATAEAGLARQPKGPHQAARAAGWARLMGSQNGSARLSPAPARPAAAKKAAVAVAPGPAVPRQSSSLRQVTQPAATPVPATSSQQQPSARKRMRRPQDGAGSHQGVEGPGDAAAGKVRPQQRVARRVDPSGHDPVRISSVSSLGMAERPAKQGPSAQPEAGTPLPAGPEGLGCTTKPEGRSSSLVRSARIAKAEGRSPQPVGPLGQASATLPEALAPASLSQVAAGPSLGQQPGTQQQRRGQDMRNRLSETITITDSDGDSDAKPASQGSSHSQAARGRQVGGKCAVGAAGPVCVMLLPTGLTPSWWQ